MKTDKGIGMIRIGDRGGGQRLLTSIVIVAVLMMGIMARSSNVVNAAAGTVTLKYGSDISYGDGIAGHTSMKWVTHIDGEAVDLDDVPGVSRSYAYCVQPTADAPSEGTYPVTLVDDDDTGKISKMRKLIYYLPGSYGYAKVTKKRWFSDYSTSDAYVIGHLALSWIYDNYSDSYSVWGGAPSSMVNKAKNIVDDLSKLKDPSDDYEVFWVKVSGKQDVFGAFYKYEYGKGTIKKSSAVSGTTDDNGEYSLAGAEYTIYVDEKCSEIAKTSDGTDAVLITKADGSSNEIEMETGSYYVKETKAPKGYTADTKVYGIEITKDKTSTLHVQEIPKSDIVGILLSKLDNQKNIGSAQGDGSLAGAVYKFSYYDGQYSSVSAAEGSGKATATWYFETNAKGEISGTSPKTASGYTSSALYKDSDGKVAFPLGSYVIREVKAPKGYILNNEKQLVKITEDGTDNAHVKTYNEKTSSSEDIIRGGVKLAKIDHDRNTAVPQGDATLEGAEFTIYNKSKESVMVSGKEIAKDAAALVIKTDASGKAASAAKALPYGTYLVKETKAPTGYHLNETWSKTFSIRTDGEVKDISTEPADENVQRGGVKVQKVDKDLKRAYAQGDATLAGAEFTITNQSAQSVIVGGKEYAKGAVVMTIRTDANGAAATANNVLPYGTYSIKETKPSTGYLLNTTWTKTFEIREPNKIVDLGGEATDEPIIRGGVKLAKIDHDRNTAVPQGDATLEGAEFTIYNKSKESVMVGGKEIAKDAAALVIKTDSGGKAASAAKALPYGTYLVKETKAPTGYHLNETWSKTFSIRTDGEVKDLSADPADDNVQRGGVKVQKVDKDLKRAYAQGDATLAGAEFTITNQSAQSVIVGGKEYAKGAAVMTIRTDANGAAATANNVLPYGTYSIKETKPSTGYLLNATWTKTFEIREPNKIVDLGGEATDEPIIRGGVKLSKIDNDLDEAYAQGDATLAGAEFTIYNKSAHNVYVDGKEQAKDAAVLTIKTDANGIAATSADVLPYGTYLIKETKPSAGYLLNTEWNATFQIRENGKIIDLTENKVREAVERGGVQIVKRDKELAKSEAMGGATLSDIVFTIKNVSGHDVVVRKDIGDTEARVDWKKLESKETLFKDETIKRVKPGEDVGKIVTHWNEEKKAYTAETLPDDLPYGTYTIRETKTNNSYQRTDKTEHKFEVRKDGTVYAYDSEGLENILTFDDYVYRSDLQGTKIGDGDSRRFSYVPFKITSVSNGETHVVVADNNGFFSTKDRRTADELEEEEGADTARKVNPFDDLLEAKEIKKADLQKRSSEMLMGVWFGTGEFGSKAEMNPKFGALPYDSYIIEEIPCDENEGYTMQKFFFTVDQKSQNGFVDLETVTNDYKEVPEIGTEASVDGKNADVSPSKGITLTDTIEYSGLKKLTKYVAKGKLVDKATGEVIKDASGKEITAEKEFTTVLSRGKVKVTFTFDGSNMYGKDTVVFETVYDMEGHVIAKHEDVNDEGQTVTWEHMKPSYEMYKIRTTKAPSKGDKFGFFAQDEVEYEVHVENTGNVVLTMDVSDQFTQNAEYFTVPKLKDVKFDGEGTWNNKDIFTEGNEQPNVSGTDAEQVANITINPSEKAVVSYTAVVKDEAKEYLAAAAADSDSLDGQGKDTNMSYQKNTPDDKDGYINTASCDNVTYPNPDKPDEPRSLEPKKDIAQTPVQKPEIGTTLTADGKKEVISSEKTVLTDEIEYKALDTSKWYVFEGALMVKETTDPLVENGKPVTVTSDPFKPAASNGKQSITFTIDTRGLEGKELVAFEIAYRLDGYEKGDDVSKDKRTAVAEHKDINDKGQTVRIVKPEEPETPPANDEPPKEPAKPKQPEIPEKPEVPNQPDKPEEPSKPGKPRSPKTGDGMSESILYCLAGIVVSLEALLLTAKRRNDRLK